MAVFEKPSASQARASRTRCIGNLPRWNSAPVGALSALDTTMPRPVAGAACPPARLPGQLAAVGMPEGTGLRLVEAVHPCDKPFRGHVWRDVASAPDHVGRHVTRMQQVDGDAAWPEVDRK